MGAAWRFAVCCGAAAIVAAFSASAFAGAPTSGGNGAAAIRLGFNVGSGFRGDSREINYLRSELHQLSAAGVPVKHLYFRVFGGNSSLRILPNQWTDSEISDWVRLQRQYHVNYVFTVNYNSTPSSQYAFYRRWLKTGATFKFIELGNELYLPWFASGNTKHNTVGARTASMTPDKYIAMSKAYMRAFTKAAVPFYMLLAPYRPNKASYMVWDRKVESAIANGSLAKQVAGVTVHLYQYGARPPDLARQLKFIRDQLSSTDHIAVTEFGVQMRPHLKTCSGPRYDLFVQRTTRYIQLLHDALKPGDSMFYHALYANRRVKHCNPFVFYAGDDGITPVGVAVFNVYKTYLLDAKQ